MTQTLASTAFAPGNGALAQNAYHDIHELQQLKTLGQHDKSASLDAISRQFESLLVHQMLKSMRSANDVWAKDGMFNSSRVSFYQQMLDDQFSVELTKNGGLGFAETIERQFARSYGDKETDTAKTADQPYSIANVQVINKLKEASKNVSALPVSAATAAQQTPDPVAGNKNALQKIGTELNTDSPQSFIQSLLPYATDAAQQLGVPSEAIIAQAALETGWGQHVLSHSNGNSSYNLFGIKAGNSWQGDTVNAETTEFFAGKPLKVNAQFRSYASLQQAFDDYVQFLSENPRYSAVHNSDSAFASTLQRAGYATDPQYANKINQVSQRVVVDMHTGDSL